MKWPPILALLLFSTATGLAQTECGSLQSLPVLNALDSVGMVRKNACWDQVLRKLTFPLIDLSALSTSVGFTSLLISPTVPIIADNGCGGTGAVITSANGTAAFDIDVGVAPTAAGCTLTMPLTNDDWHCWVGDYTTISATVFMQRQTAGSTNSIKLQNFNSGISAAAPTAHDIYHVICMGH